MSRDFRAVIKSAASAASPKNSKTSRTKLQKSDIVINDNNNDNYNEQILSDPQPKKKYQPQLIVQYFLLSERQIFSK